MQVTMKEIVGQLQSGNFSLTDNGYRELKRALVVTVMDIAGKVDKKGNRGCE